MIKFTMRVSLSLALACICAAAAFIITGCKKKDEIKFMAEVTAQPYLALRESPSSNGRKIGELPYRSQVELLREAGPEETIKGIKGTWLKVKSAGGKTGWAFNAYLSIVSKKDRKNAPDSPDGYRAPDRYDEQTRAIETLIVNPLGLYNPKEKKNRVNDITARYGPPEKTEDVADQRIHEVGECTSHRIHYTNLDINLFCGEYVFDATLTGPGRELNGGVKVGMTREQVEKKFGPPDYEKGGMMCYHLNSFFARDQFSAVKFYLKNGIVEKVETYNHPN